MEKETRKLHTINYIYNFFSHELKQTYSKYNHVKK